MNATRFWAALGFLGLAACGGSAFDLAPSDGEPLAAACPSFGGYVTLGDDGGVVGATGQASTAQTECLDAHCEQAATCNETTSALPVCVTYANGGILLSLWVCPIGCCY